MLSSISLWKQRETTNYEEKKIVSMEKKNMDQVHTTMVEFS